MVVRSLLLATCIVAYALVALVAGASTYQLISPDSSCRSGRPLRTFLSRSREDGVDEGKFSVVGVIDICSATSTDIVNRIFDTNFKADNNGIALELSGDKAVLLSTFDSMFSASFCGCKAAEYTGLVSDAICVVVPEVDLTETLDAHDQLFRRMFAKLNSKKMSQPVPFIVVLTSPGKIEDDMSDNVQRYLESVWKDINNQVLSCILSLLLRS